MKPANQIWVAFALAITSLIIVNALSLYAFKQNLVDSRKREITSVLQFARSQATIYVDKHASGELSRQQAEQAIVAALSSMNHDARYIWANDEHAIARVHVRPEIVGQFQTSYVHHMQLLSRQDIAFITKTNVKPVIEQRVLKMNGVTKLPDWHWVIGYGVYMDDVEQEFLRIAFKNFMINALIIILSGIGIAIFITRLDQKVKPT